VAYQRFNAARMAQPRVRGGTTATDHRRSEFSRARRRGAVGLDTAKGGRIAAWTAHSLIWRDGLGGLPSPGPLWLAAWTLDGVPHSFATSWLWGGMAANYPSGRLKATFVLASRAGRRAPWLFHSTLSTSVILGVLTSGVPGFRLLRKR